LPDHYHENHYLLPQLNAAFQNVVRDEVDDEEMSDPLSSFGTDEDLFAYLLDNSQYLSSAVRVTKKIDPSAFNNLITSVFKFLHTHRVSGLPQVMTLADAYEECTRTTVKDIIFKVSCKNFGIIMGFVQNAILEK